MLVVGWESAMNTLTEKLYLTSPSISTLMPVISAYDLGKSYILNSAGLSLPSVEH